MSAGSILEHIDAVDAVARTLFLRAKQYSSASLSDVATAVRQLHLALRHLRIEAADPDSLLNKGTDSSLYSRQVPSLVEDCDFVLRQLLAVLDRYDTNDGRDVAVLADRVMAIRARLANEKTNVEMFLDTVQLHLPANMRSAGSALGDGAGLDDIKDKVDKIAAGLFGRRDIAGTADDDDRLWQDFKSELENEGFSSQVLSRHKEVLRAYILELASVSRLTGGDPPPVRQLLELEQDTKDSVLPPVPPKVLPLETKHPSLESEKSFPSTRNAQRMAGEASTTRTPQKESYSFSSDDGATSKSNSMALMSTKDLMVMDHLHADMARMRLNPLVPRGHGAEPRSRQSRGTSDATGARLLASVPDLAGSPDSLVLGSSPNYVLALPPYSNLSSGTSQRPVPPRIAPDRYGQEIPLDAPWTKIKRTLVSPEVLERAGVRYEARPEYVAVLGRLSREQIAEYARQSAECRAARSGNPTQPRVGGMNRSGSKSSRDDDDEDESELWDESDTSDEDDRAADKGTRRYPYIVSPPSKNKTSPASTAMPKPILKNKNENRVRFDPEPQEFEARSSRSFKEERDRRSDYAPRKPRDQRDREPSSRNRDGYRREGGERDRHGSDYHRSSHRADRDRRGDRREDRAARKRAWGGTIGAVGIGGAAASLIGVLTEAAVGI
ncbi:hypothetical protein DCS_03622 [Drechmeria coniospora]|uniref:DUF8035 domain-containing protein n=1 Tax=Drechmeria coniospora TaxID=98403 RepID=A0A151GHV4_DRECN|nr:hypothetical protein DCS_03622 [Drechmeria coniospora]KYK56621.1 hypothetical protein DCS_03622 [Drechmeria coniospora]ODA77059.1 hypothetical protein RJ55_07577 [Drechmeria coniospora]